MRTLWILLAVLCVCGVAGAEPCDPDPDGMSVYFDMEGTSICIDDPGIYMPMPVYIVLTRPSTTAPGLLSWEARIEVETDAAFGVEDGFVQWSFSGNGTNTGGPEDLIVDLGGSSLPITGDATILATAQLVFAAPGGHAQFMIGPTTESITIPGAAGYTDGNGSTIPCLPIFGNWELPCAWIDPWFFGWNCEYFCMDIANEPMTWGQVKALY